MLREIKILHKNKAAEVIVDRHYSHVMPSLTRYYCGYFVNDELQNLKQQVNSLNLEVEHEEFGAEGKKLTNSFTFEFKDISKLDSMIRLKKYITYIITIHH